MLKRHEVEILLKAGHAKTEAARLSGISLRSVNGSRKRVVGVLSYYGREPFESRPYTVIGISVGRLAAGSPR